ncbi:MAG: SsrA-binding protein SmpB [Candidatus Dojkabacteria bacterium]|jgi:SsrA-binding protein
MRISNKKANFNYDVVESFEAGVVLTGAEVKSVKDGRVNLEDSFVKIIDGELYLVNADITKYKYDGREQYDSRRSRKLLVKKRELIQVESKMKSKKLVLIPLAMYATRGIIKVQVGLCRGRKRHEKKDREKERDMNRELLYENRKYVV